MDDYDINKQLIERLDSAEMVIKYAELIISGKHDESTKMCYERCLQEWKKIDN